MTLQQWAELANRGLRPYRNSRTGEVREDVFPIPYSGLTEKEYRDLFCLSDAVVSSVTGGTCWLIRRQSR